MRILFIALGIILFQKTFSQNNSLLVHSGEVIAEGIKYYEDEKYDKAIFKYRQVSDCDTNYAIALYETGLAYLAQKDYEQAIQTFQKGLKLESEQRVNFIQQLGNAYSSKGDFEKAMNTYRQGIREYPNYFRYYYEMGAACYTAKKHKLALSYLDSCLKMNFGYGRAHFLMGEICQENNYFIPAILSFQMAAYLSNTDKIGLVSLSEIQKIAAGETRDNKKDSIVQLFPKSENNFEELEEIIRSKTELDAKYKVKPAVKLPFTTVIKCLHIVNSRVAMQTDVSGWYADHLLPIYKEWWNNEEFATVMYRICVSTGKDEALKMFKKNADPIRQQYTRFFSHFLKKKVLYESRIDNCQGEYKHLFLYDNDNLFVMVPGNESYSLSKGLSPKNGYYVYYYNNGIVKKEGRYENAAEAGVWKYYTETGALKNTYDVISPTEYTYVKYYLNGNPEEKGEVKNQKNTGKLYRYYANGNVERVIPLNDREQIDGDVFKYYDNGQLMVIMPFADGSMKDGEQVNYYRDGSVYYRENYKNEKQDGDYTEYYRNGQIKTQGKYKAGKPDGKWNKFHMNGKLAEEFSYQNGELSGSYKEYYNTGTIKSESTYSNGDNTGKTYHYDFDGKKYAEYYDSKGKTRSATYFDKNGKIVHEADVSKTDVPFMKYNSIGIKIEEGKVMKDYRVGLWKFYNDNGSLYMTKEFDNKGNADGGVEEFYADGNVRKRYTLVDNKIDGYYEEFFRGGGKLLEGYYVDGNKQGVWKKYYANGNQYTETYYLNNEVYGVEKTFYMNGKLKSTEENKEGLFIRFTLYDTSGKEISTDTIGYNFGRLMIKDKNGNTYLDNYYKGNMLDGIQYSYWGNKNVKNKQERVYGEMVKTEYDYFQSGKTKAVTFYKYGEMDSVYTEYFENGNVEYSASYKYGEANGPEKFYYDNGKIELKGEQVEGEKEGWYEFLAPDGHLQYKVLFHRGVIISYTYQDKDGKLMKEIPFTNASGDFNSFFSNGNPSAKGAYLNGDRHGVYTKYYFNGKKSYEGTYKNGTLNGTYTYYHENGKIKEQVTYVNGLKEGVEKHYDDKGNLVKETTYEGNYKHGPERIYNAGKLLRTINYEFDNTYDN